MEILNLSGNNGARAKKNSKARAFIGIGIIAAAVGLSSTLAANIGINSGPVEFGQGVAQTVACSGEESIIVTPASTFSNEGVDVNTVFTEHDSGPYSGSGWLQVASTAGITVGMVVSDGDGPVEENSVVIGFGDGGVYISKETASTDGIPSGRFPVTFSESRGTPQTATIGGHTAHENYSDFELETWAGLAVGMLVTGTGIQPETVITYVDGGAIYISKVASNPTGDLTFTNSVSGVQGSFKLSDITVSGIPDSCSDKVFTIKIYDNSNSAPLNISSWDNPDDSVRVWWADGGRGMAQNFAMVQFPSSGRVYYDYNYSAYNGGYAVETNNDTDLPVGSFKVNLPTAVDASKVYKITVESQDDSGSLNVGYAGQSFWGYQD
jgi:hypothetical protein